MNAVMQSMLKSVSGEPLVLQGTHIEASLHELFAEITFTQHFSNPSSNNIEAVYTFPLPLDAVLMETEIIIGDRHLTGVVMAKKEAEEEYENAITDGDMAVMLEKSEPGIYTINVGNLLPDESVTIIYRYAMLMRWNGNQLRLHIPTTIAPRYGTPANLKPHQVPVTDMLVENRSGFHLKAHGQLGTARVNSPSHEISFQSQGDHLSVLIPDNELLMDRDIILLFSTDNTQQCGGFVGRDDNEYVALASFHLPQPEVEQQQPLHIKLVVDCSGSMGGDSIAQAKVALTRILDSLKPHDRFNLTAFGSHHQTLFTDSMPATGEPLEQARSFVNKLDASYGGTEIGAALSAAYAIGHTDEITPQVLLITDGEIWDTEPVISAAIRSQHRIFTVGVGNSVAEGFVRELATRTGGQCELVSPNEVMAERIHRHFQRMQMAPVKSIDVNWPSSPLPDRLPNQLNTVFGGDTMHLFGWFDAPPSGKVSLKAELADGTRLEQTIALDNTAFNTTESYSSLARLAAQRRLSFIDDTKQATELACKYQLVSEWTNTLMIDVRAEGEKAETLPELHQVKQMLAAGWGGTGNTLVPKPDLCCASVAATPSCRSLSTDGMLFSKVMRSNVICESQSPYGYSTPHQFVKRVDKRLSGLASRAFCSYNELAELDLPEIVIDHLMELFGDRDEGIVVICFLYAISCSPIGQALFGRTSRRKILKAVKAHPDYQDLIDQMDWINICLEDDSWNELE